MKDVITAQDAIRIARAVAARYRRRCWWADVDDLTSEGVRAILMASRTWDPQVGIPLDGYVARAARNAAHDYLWRESSPVSGGLHDPRQHIAGVRRASLSDDGPDSPKLAAFKRRVDEVLSYDPRGDMELVDVEELRLAVRERIRALAEQVPNGDLAVEVMVRGRKPIDVRRDTGRNPYKAVEAVRRRMREDYQTWTLWKHGVEGEQP